jgi:SAM-dependent methyltransferase
LTGNNIFLEKTMLKQEIYPKPEPVKNNNKESIDFGKNSKKIIDEARELAYEVDERTAEKISVIKIEKIFSLNKEYATESIFRDLPYLDSMIGWRMIVILIDILGAEQVRGKINQIIETIANDSNDDYNRDFKNQRDRDWHKDFALKRLHFFRSCFTPNHDKVAIENLQKFYQEKIKFEDYKVNQEMNAGEVELLQELIDKNEKVLEEGCGTGRLLLEMEKAGYDVTGFDFTARHTEIIKEQNPEAKVLQGDWHQTGFKDASFDAIYSLGRNILHDYSIVDQVQLFREANRILKSGGKFIFDIPNREKGGYRMLVGEYTNEMKKLGVRNFREGAIYDSPDGVNFATRYAYCENDIQMLADLTGFKIIEVRRKKLATGKGDENLYFVLEKILSRK